MDRTRAVAQTSEELIEVPPAVEEKSQVLHHRHLDAEVNPCCIGPQKVAHIGM